jgi:hypothetical protein
MTSRASGGVPRGLAREVVAAQTARPRPGRHAWLGAARRARDGMARWVRRQRLGAVLLTFGNGGRCARLVSEAPTFAHGMVHTIIAVALLLLHHGCACCCVACAASIVLHCECFCLLSIAREQVAGTGQVCTTGVVCSSLWRMDGWISCRHT